MLYIVRKNQVETELFLFKFPIRTLQKPPKEVSYKALGFKQI